MFNYLLKILKRLGKVLISPFIYLWRKIVKLYEKIYPVLEKIYGIIKYVYLKVNKFYREHFWTSQQWCREGNYRLKIKQLEIAINCYDKAIKKQNDNYLAWRNKAYILYILHDLTGALECYNIALGFKNDDPQVWLEKAIILENQFNLISKNKSEKYEEMMLTYRQVLTLDENNLTALINHGNFLWQKEDYDQVKIDYQKVLQQQPDHEEIKERLNYILEQERLEKLLFKIFPPEKSELYRNIVNRYKQALKTGENLKEILIEKGQILADLVNYNELVAQIENQLKSPDIKQKNKQDLRAVTKILAKDLLNTGVSIYELILANIKVYDNPNIIIAKKIIDDSLIFQPKSPKAWWYKGRILKYNLKLSHLEMCKKRLFCYFKALHFINKGDIDYNQIYNEHLILRNHIVADLKELAQAHIEHHEFKAAIHDFQESINLLKQTDNSEEELINTYRMRGHLYQQLKLYERALNDYTEALNIPWENKHIIYVERGFIYHCLKNFEKAIEDFSLAIEIKPSFDAYDHRGMVYLSEANYQQAIDDFNLALELSPCDGNCVYRRGFAQVHLGNIQEAIDDFLEATELFRYDGKIECYRIAFQAMSSLKKSHPEDIISPDQLPEEITVRPESHYQETEENPEENLTKNEQEIPLEHESN